jgi:uncharacterized integral membrane protein
MQDAEGSAPARGNGGQGAGPVPRPSRLGGLWWALAGGAVVLLLLLIFILENGQSVDIAYFGLHGRLPLGVALLLAAVCGTLLVVIPGAGRMLQLRLATRRAVKRSAVIPPPATPPSAPPTAPASPAAPAVPPEPAALPDEAGTDGGATQSG